MERGTCSRMKTRRFAAALMVVALALTAFLSGCSGSSSSSQTKPAETPKQDAPKQEAPKQEAPKQEAPKPPIKIAIVTSRSGVFELWGTHEIRGLKIGLEYATGGKMEVGGRKIELKEYDDQGKPEVGKALAEQAITEWKADIIQGAVSSGIAAQIIPVIDQYKKIFMIEPAAADSLTAPLTSKYVFRTGRNNGQDAAAGAAYAATLGKKIYQLAPDYQFGKDAAAAWESIMKANGATVTSEFAPVTTADFTPILQKIVAAKPDVLITHWAGSGVTKLFQQMGEQKIAEKMKVTGVIADFAAMKIMGPAAVGSQGPTPYFHTLAKNEVNDYLIKRHKELYNNELPDLFTGGGMAAGIAIVEGLKKTNGDADGDKLVAAMEGMKFKGPKGEMEFRKEDHQALQPIYIVELKMNPGFDFPTPTLIKEMSGKDSAPPLVPKK